MTKLAQLIAKMEGFGKPGALPTVDNNPGDLRHSPHSQHSPDDPNAIGRIDTIADGWADLERQLRIYAARGMTLQQAIFAWAPATDGNDPSNYLKFVCDGLGMTSDTPVAVALQSIA